MGTHVIKVPDVGEGIAEVELVAWTVGVGDTVKRNQILAEVMTDKANVEIPSPVDGVIATLNGEVGGVMAVGSSLIELSVEGAVDHGVDAPVAPAGVDAPLRRTSPALDEVNLTLSVVANGSDDAAGANGGPDRASGAGRTADHGAVGQRPPRAEGERPLASPAVRHRARQAGIDLRRVAGTGPAGRITHEDLDAHWHDSDAAAGGPVGPLAGGARQPDQRVDREPIIGIRRQIARRMLAATQSIPHITYVEEVDVTALEELRAALNGGARTNGDAGSAADRPRLTLLPFLIRAMVDALTEFPQMNAHVDDEAGTLTTYGGVHVGIATQTPNGLVVPVVRHAEAATMWELAAQIADRAERARTQKAAPADLTGSTITITSLGPLGGIVTTPVINKPEVAVIGINKIATRPVFVDGEVVARKMMNLSSSFDHRIIDGWDAAMFVQRIRALLEQPGLLFVEDATGVRP